MHSRRPSSIQQAIANPEEEATEYAQDTGHCASGALPNHGRLLHVHCHSTLLCAAHFHGHQRLKSRLLNR